MILHIVNQRLCCPHIARVTH